MFSMGEGLCQSLQIVQIFTGPLIGRLLQEHSDLSLHWLLGYVFPRKLEFSLYMYFIHQVR